MSDDNTFHQQNAHNDSSENFGSVRNDAESFGNVPNGSEQAGTFPILSEELERTKKYLFTVRAATRMFEEAGVPRTERSIVNWCSPNKHGVPRLTCKYDMNELRWFITEESIRTAIAEEIVKQRELEARNAQVPEHPGPAEGHDEQRREEDRPERTNERTFERTTFEDEVTAPEKDKKIRELEYELRNEKITSRAKDQVIDKMQDQHMHLIDQVAIWSRQVGVLETKLLQIEAPKQRYEEEKPSVHFYPADVPNDSEQNESNLVREGE